MSLSGACAGPWPCLDLDLLAEKRAIKSLQFLDLLLVAGLFWFLMRACTSWEDSYQKS